MGSMVPRKQKYETETVKLGCLETWHVCIPLLPLYVRTCEKFVDCTRISGGSLADLWPGLAA